MARARSGEERSPDEDALRQIEDHFISCWGEIAQLWGVNRTVGRIHALLFLSPEPMSSDQITERLGISHGNTSQSLHALLAWGVLRRVHVLGEKKARYEAEPEAWTWFHTCVSERRRRDVLPVIGVLHQVRDRVVAEAASQGTANQRLRVARERIEGFTTFMDEFNQLIDAFLAAGHGPLAKTLRSLARVASARGGRRRPV
jgi:DNA-binding transcriptional regulator GbsR (MarR family)